MSINTTGGRPRITGTRIKVAQIANECHRLNMPVSEILEAHPHLTREQVEAALQYYDEHQEEIQREWDETDALIKELGG